MSRHGVIVKKLSALHNFGSLDTLATDKTGTLTQDRIELVRYLDPTGREDKRVTIGAKNFSEQYILASMIEDRLHAAGYRTERRDDLVRPETGTRCQRHPGGIVDDAQDLSVSAARVRAFGEAGEPSR